MNLATLQRFDLNPVRPEFLDSSALGDFVKCPSYYYLRHVLGLRRRVHETGSTDAIDWGTCWHATLEAFNSGGRDLAAGLAALEAHYPSDIQPTTDRYKRSKKRMINAFFAYAERYEGEDLETTIIRNEQHFQIYSEKDDLEWSGRVDSVRRRRGKLLAWDYKSTSSMGASYFDQFELSFQFPGYVWATRQLASEPVNEICLDVYYTVSTKEEFFRRTFRYTDADLGEWVANVKLWRDRLFHLLDNHLYDPEAWPKAWGQCAWWYGRKCPFFDVHSISPSDDTRLHVLQQDYEEHRWNPLDES